MKIDLISENQIATKKATEKTANVFEAMYFSRIVSLSGIVNRYINISLKKEVNWLRLRTLIIIVELGKRLYTFSKYRDCTATGIAMIAGFNLYFFEMTCRQLVSVHSFASREAAF